MSNPILHLDRTNGRGPTYRQVLHAAALEVERCIRQMPFDIVVQDVSLGGGRDVGTNNRHREGASSSRPLDRPPRLRYLLAVRITCTGPIRPDGSSGESAR